MERMRNELIYSWIIPGRLAVGETPPSLSRLRELGFQAVLNLQEEDEPNPTLDDLEAVRCVRVAIRDGIVGGVPSLEDLARAVEALQGFLGSSLPTYVHCYAGVGRSPTVCMAYLAVSEGATLSDAYRRVAEAHPRTSPTAGQLSALALFLSSRSEIGEGGP